jgi:hypothetical protein
MSKKVRLMMLSQSISCSQTLVVRKFPGGPLRAARPVR